jgi:site-specific DNA-methyltransferase (adenine-specific)
MKSERREGCLIMIDNLLNTITLADCMDIMKDIPDKYIDLAIIDPPYGRKEHGGRDRSSLCKQKNGSKIFVNGNKYNKKQWDDIPVGSEYFKELFRISKNQIIWGCNYYKEQFGPGRIVWDKCNDGSSQSDCELAYNSMNSRVDIVRYMWRGMMQGKSITEGTVQQGNKKLNEKRIHPTQKPVILYQWILRKYAKPGNIIIDTHSGSGSCAVACYLEGFNFIAIEKDVDYHPASIVRLNDIRKQGRLFI